MEPKKIKKLVLIKETISSLDSQKQNEIRGGVAGDINSVTCPGGLMEQWTMTCSSDDVETNGCDSMADCGGDNGYDDVPDISDIPDIGSWS